MKQFRTTGRLEINDIEDFKQKLDSPTSYKPKDFKRFVLDVAINELKEKKCFKNLQFEPKRAKKRGSPITGYTFTFEPEQIKKKVTAKKKEQIEAQEQNYSSWTEQAKTQMNKTQQTYTSKPLNHRFNAFPQRNYSKEEYKEIEKKLLRR